MWFFSAKENPLLLHTYANYSYKYVKMELIIECDIRQAHNFPHTITTRMDQGLHTTLSLLRTCRPPLQATGCIRRQGPIRRRALHCSRVLQDEGRSFRGQLYDSTFNRLQRERAEQQRLAKERAEPQSLAKQLRWAAGTTPLCSS